MDSTAPSLAILCSFCCLVAGCSLLFSESDPQSIQDAAASDAAILPDAANLPTCGVELPDTLEQFSFTGTEGTDHIAGSEESIMEAKSIDTDGQLFDSMVSTVPGPAGVCGEAVDSSETSALTMAADNHLAGVSIDFWFNIDQASKIRTGLVTKDARFVNQGDFSLMIYHKEKLEEFFLIFRLQPPRSNPPSGNGAEGYYLCSSSLTLKTWHHVAVSFGDFPVMYVDGMAVNSSQTLPSEFGLAMCGQELGTGARTLNPFATDKEWMLGAGNYKNDPTGESTDGESRPASEPFIGFIDEVRIRSKPFNDGEARRVYKAVFP